MKLPVLWIVAAFTAGIAISNRWPASLKLWIAAALAAMLLGGLLAWRERILAAGAFGLIAWVALGGLAMNGERASTPQNHITHLIAAGRLDTNLAMRWQGRLREDPMSLPWGRRYELDLEQVQVGDTRVPVSGGLRLNWYGDEHAANASSLPDPLRAGDRVEALVKARPPRNFLDPGAFDLYGYMARQNINLIGSLRSRELLQLIDRPRPTVAQRFARARGNLLARLDNLFPGQTQRTAVLRAMLLGDRGFVDSETVAAFQKTSAYHVLVVAGLHVGALVVILFWFSRRFRLPIGIASLLTLAVLAAYVGVVQDRPSILRAALMAAFYVCARPLFRRVELLNTVALAALAILLWKPSSLIDPGFELSFLASGVIAALALPWMERSSAPYRAGLRHLGDRTRDGAHPPKIAQFRIELRAASERVASWLPERLAPRASALLTLPIRAGLRLWEIVLLSAVIQWGMMPLLARDFHRVSWTGPVSNIPAVILTGFIVPLGFLTLLATFLSSALGTILAKALGFFTGLLLANVQWFGRLPRVSYRVPGPPFWLVAGFFAALILLAAAARVAALKRMTRVARRGFPPPIAWIEWISGAALVALTILIAWHPFAPNLARGKLEVSVLDVGQGDSIFTAFPDGRTMLVDGGGLAGSEWTGGVRSGTDVGEDVVSPYLWSRGLKRLDVVALTHADHDHIDGLHSVIENFQVGELWIGRDEDRPAFKSLIEEARARGVSVVHRAEGEGADWDGARADVLWPPGDGSAGKSTNDNSLVLRLSDGQTHFLLTGDIEQSAEGKLVGERVPLSADFLKVPHHGSKTSSTDAFLGAVTPRVAIVSVGEANPFGHPAEAIVERYTQDGIRLLRTDRDGAVTAMMDGRNFSVGTFSERHLQ